MQNSRLTISLSAAVLASGLLAAGAVPASSSSQGAPEVAGSEVCGSYSVNGNRYWSNCTSAGQEVRWHVVLPPSLYNYACVPAGESQYIGPSATVWDVFATGDTC